MTIATTTAKVQALCNGVTTAFPFTFPVHQKDDVSVFETDIATSVDTLLGEGSGYTITLIANGGQGGTVTITPALPTGKKVTILREISLTQEDYNPSPGGTYYADELERAMDRRVMQIQQLAEILSRTLTIAGGVDGIDLTLPSPSPGSLIGWDLEGTGLMNWTPEGIAATELYADWIAEVFTGDGATTFFALQRSPGSLGNMDVMVDGRQMIAGEEYSLSGQAIEFTTAPANTKKIQVRYGTAAAQSVPLAYQRFVATEGQTLFTLPSVYALGTNAIQVYLNGLKLSPGFDFAETSSSEVTLTLGAVAGDELEVYWGRLITSGVVDTQHIEDDAVTPAKLAPGIYVDQVGDFRLGNHPAAREGTWLQCNGAAVSRTTYAALFARLGTTYGAGDGSTTFALPTIAAVSGGAANIPWYVRAI